MYMVYVKGDSIYMHLYVFAFVCVCVFACVPVSSLRVEQLWWAGQRAPTLGSGEEQARELQGSFRPGGRPQYPQHGPAVPSAPGYQPGTQQPGGGDDAENAQLQ